MHPSIMAYMPIIACSSVHAPLQSDAAGVERLRLVARPLHAYYAWMRWQQAQKPTICGCCSCWIQGSCWLPLRSRLHPELTEQRADLQRFLVDDGGAPRDPQGDHPAIIPL